MYVRCFIPKCLKQLGLGQGHSCMPGTRSRSAMVRRQEAVEQSPLAPRGCIGRKLVLGAKVQPRHSDMGCRHLSCLPLILSYMPKDLFAGSLLSAR